MGLNSSQQSFIQSIWPNALATSQSTGVDARIIAAQAALESGWGRSAPDNNLFGIKGAGNSYNTQEFINGKMVTTSDSFAGYSSTADSFNGYANLINGSSRYDAVQNASGLDAQISALGASGYATDPEYSNKIKSIVKSIDTHDVVNGTVAAAQFATGDIFGGIASLFGKGQGGNANQALGTGGSNSDEEDDGGIIGWLKRFFSVNTAARFAAVAVALLLIGLALWSFVSDAKGSIISTVIKGAGKVGSSTVSS